MTSHPNLIGGEWVAGTPSPNINPSNTAETIAHYDQASREQGRYAADFYTAVKTAYVNPA